MAKLIDTTQLKYFYSKLKNVFAPKSHTHGEATELKWGGGNISGGFSPIDASLAPMLGANRLAFGNASGIKVEYSRDGGSTWTDYGASDGAKINLFSVLGASNFGIGKYDSTNKATSDYQLRVTITTDLYGVYTSLNKFVMYVSTNGSNGCWCSIDGALYDTPTVWKNFANKANISGWSGYNVINTSSIITYGNTKSTQYRYLRFTFGCASGSTTYNGLVIYNIFGYGGVGWIEPSNMARIGSLFSYDWCQNAIFPSNIYAKTFVGALSGNATTATKATQDSSGQQINTTYVKNASVSGRTITFTKGNGTTFTLTTQDTTYAVATQSSNGLLSASDKQKLDKLASKNMNMNLTSLWSGQLNGGTSQVTLSQNISNFVGLIFETIDNGTKRRLMVWKIPNGNGNVTTYPYEYPLAYNCGVYHDANTMINNAIWSVQIGNYSTSSNVITVTSNLLSGTSTTPKPITAIYGFNFI